MSKIEGGDDSASLYYQAAEILKKVKLKRGTVKTLIYASGYTNLRQMFALVSECIKYQPLLEEVASDCPRQLLLDPAINEDLEVTVVLLYEHLLGRKFGRAVRFRKLFQPFKGDIKSAVEKVLASYDAKTLQEARQASSQGVIPKIPRYMRINLIKSSVDSAIENLQAEGWEFVGKFSQEEFSTRALALTQYQFGLDPVVCDLLVFPPDTDLHAHAMTTSGVLVQQDRASCIPAHALAPPPGSFVIDSCAAPGNKTSHLASLMQDQGQVVALDRDFKRLGTMSRLLGNSGATCIELVHQDFLTVEPDSDDANNIQFILVDPSCSGSGMLNAQTNSEGSESDPGRIQTLKRFQISILKHALRFPNTKRVVYSTCSVHKEENEEVAEEVMSQVKDAFRFTKVLPQWRGSRGLDEFPHAGNFLRLSPARDLTQGFFVACFERLDLEGGSDEIGDVEECGVLSSEDQTGLDSVGARNGKARHLNGDSVSSDAMAKKRKRKRKNDNAGETNSHSESNQPGKEGEPDSELVGDISTMEENGANTMVQERKKKKKKTRDSHNCADPSRPEVVGEDSDKNPAIYESVQTEGAKTAVLSLEEKKSKKSKKKRRSEDRPETNVDTSLDEGHELKVDDNSQPKKKKRKNK